MSHHLSPNTFCFLAFAPFVFFGWSSDLKATQTSINYDRSGNTASQQSSTSAPTITSQPASLFAASPSFSAGFSVTAASPSPVTYQWYFQGNPIPGATGDSLLFNNPTLANEGLYTVIVTNSLGSVTSNPSRLVIDASGNGLGDAWEMQYFGNLDQSPNADPDGDQLTNVEELTNGTNPLVRDAYYWTAASGDFDNPANWNWKRVPGLGDAAYINSGAFTINAAGAAPKVNLTVNQPYTFSPTADTTLALKGTWTLNGPVTLTTGRTLKVTSGALTLNGPTTLNGANLVAQGNYTKFTISGLTAYTQPNNRDVTWRSGDSSVTNTGCELSFPNLTSITGGITTGSSNYSFLIFGRAGGKLNLPALTAITLPAKTGAGSSGTQLNADGGLISAPLLTQFSDATPLGNSWLQSYSGGTLSVPMLTAPSGIQFNVNANFNLTQFSSLAGTRYLRLIGGISSVLIPNIDHIREIYAINNGTKLTFPNVTTYAQPNNTNVVWRAGEPSQTNTGCELNFPNLQTIQGGVTTTSTSRYLDLIARTGAILNLPNLTSISVPAETASGSSGTRLYSLDGGTFNAARLVSFLDLSNPFVSRIEASATSQYRFTSLRAAGLQGVILSGVTLLTGPVVLQPPVITSPGSIISIVGQSLSYSIAATNQPFSRSAAPLPGGLSVNTTSGLLSGSPAAAGTFFLTLTAENADGIGTLPLTLTVTPASFDDYLNHAGVPLDQRGHLDDPDKDGQPNLLEYALGLSASTSSQAGLPDFQLTGATMSYRYTRLRSNITYTVETSTDLSNPLSWTTSGVTQGTPDAYGNVTATISATDGRRFVRLKVSMIP